MTNNPWLRTHIEDSVEVVPRVVEVGYRIWSRPGVVDSPKRLVLVGAHAGAGVTCLASLAGLPEAGFSWNGLNDDDGLVVVARGYFSGLEALSRFGRAWSDGLVPGHLLGAVVNADHPKDLKELRLQRDFIAGGFPAFWLMPFVESWRLAPGIPNGVPKQGMKVVRELRAIEEQIVRK